MITASIPFTKTSVGSAPGITSPLMKKVGVPRTISVRARTLLRANCSLAPFPFMHAVNFAMSSFTCCA
ncbi:MAG: hypothetical protein U0164_15200 [Gemmatimonadaceae bacterium]